MYNREKQELYTIREDVADPLTRHAGLDAGSALSGGVEAEVRLDGAKIEVPIRWRDRVATADVYKNSDHLLVHLYCPQCARCLSIHSKKKRIRFNESERRMDVERIRCSYEGCDWSVVIENSVARDARG